MNALGGRAPGEEREIMGGSGVEEVGGNLLGFIWRKTVFERISTLFFPRKSTS